MGGKAPHLILQTFIPAGRCCFCWFFAIFHDLRWSAWLSMWPRWRHRRLALRDPRRRPGQSLTCLEGLFGPFFLGSLGRFWVVFFFWLFWFWFWMVFGWFWSSFGQFLGCFGAAFGCMWPFWVGVDWLIDLLNGNSLRLLQGWGNRM